MPTPINTDVQNVANPAGKAHSRPHTKKTRAIRRRGRGKEVLDSDDEIEREVTTDSDSDGQSSCASDSDSESASDDEGHTGIVTPSTTQSPPPLDIDGPASSRKPKSLVNGATGPFVTPTNWAQLVADEHANGAADLPVIDFADMHTQIIPESKPAPPPPRPRKVQKHEKKTSSARAPPEPPVVATKPEATEAPSQPAEEPVASTSRGTSREPEHRRPPRGQSARQVYQQRLQDPAFVPRVGEFWGHDDRLLDKDLRSLSGWWRGRWQHRGRGRGGFSMRGRGGNPFANGAPVRDDQGQGSEVVVDEVPAVDRAWTHDGFEEMKRKEDARKDDHRRLREQQQQIESQAHTFPAQRGFRGRGGFFSGRGRGFARGGGVATPVSVSSGAAQAQDPSTQRVWFAMKPEKVWTKHTDTFLYFEPVLRARPGQTAGIRVKLPGRTGQVVRPRWQSHGVPSTLQAPTVDTATSATHEEGERQFVVRIPRPPVPKQEGAPQPAAEVAEVATTVENLSIEEVFTVRPHAVPSHIPITASQTSAGEVPELAESVVSEPAVQAEGLSNAPPAVQEPPVQQQANQIEQPPMESTQRQVQFSSAEVVAPVPQAPPVINPTRPPPPALPPLQTNFSPVPQTSPQYGSPYGYPPALPPGIAIHQGYPYDMATGRPVYLQTPPPNMYTPRPMIPGYMAPPSSNMPFVPGHMHHPSQEYISQTPTPPIGGFIDPTTGVPIFTPARQSSRIEIRAPSDRYEGKGAKPAPRPSGLRMSTSGLESDAVNGGVQQVEQQSQMTMQPPMPAMDPAMMAYAPYQQQYYYADPNGYPAYMDMSQQMMPYEMYPQPDQRTSQPVIYY